MISSAATPGSRERACHSPLRAAYTCAAVTCASPYSLVISTQSGCTICCTSDKNAGHQWHSNCLSLRSGDVLRSLFDFGYSAALSGPQMNKCILRPPKRST